MDLWAVVSKVQWPNKLSLSHTELPPVDLVSKVLGSWMTEVQGR